MTSRLAVRNLNGKHRRRGFNPASLFAPAETGFVYDPATRSSLFQDSAGTTPVTAVGQVVGRILDRSGNAVNATQATAVFKPLYARMPVGGRRNMIAATPISLWTASKGGTGIVPVVNTIVAASRATLPDGASGADTGKGWTCTGLALDGASLWWGNFGQNLEGGTIATRQLIQTDLAGTAILAAVTITSAPQGVAVYGDDLYYAAPFFNEIRRIPKAGGDEVAVATVAAVNGVATDGTTMWASSGTVVYILSMSGVVQGFFDVGVIVDHLHYDAARNWMWVTSGANGVAGVVTIWSLTENRKLNTYRFADALALEGLVISGSTIIVASDGYYHGPDIANPALRLNEIQTFPTATIFGGIWAGGLADYVYFDRGAGATSADFSQVSVDTTVAAGRVGSLYLWSAAGGEDLAVGVGDAGGVTQQVKSVTTTPTMHETARATTSGTEFFLLRLRGGVTTTAAAGLYIGGQQVETGVTPTNFQTVASSVDITEIGKSSKYALLFDQVDDAMTVTLPTGVYTVAYASDAGVTFEALQVLSGSYSIPDPTRLYGAFGINRAISATEQNQIGAWLALRCPLGAAGYTAIATADEAPAGTVMAFDGDSRVAINWTTSGTQRNNRGLLHWTSLLGSQRYDTSFGLAFAVSGESSAAILARAATTAASTSDAVLALMSTNDRGSLTVVQTLTNIVAWTAAMRAAGKVVFLCDETPRTDLAGALLTEHLAVRDAIRAMDNPSDGVYILPTWDTIASVSDNQVADATLLYDTVHPNPTGAAAMSVAANTVLDAVYAARDVLTGGTNYITNPTMTGTGGTVTAPATGVAPTSWTLRGNGLDPVALTGSKVTEDGKEWLRMVLAGTTPASGTLEAQLFQDLSVASFAENDVVEALIRVKIADVTHIRQVALWALYGNALASSVIDGFNSTTFELNGGPWEGVMRTPKFVVPAINTQMRFLMTVRGIASTAMTADLMVTDAVWRKVV